MSWLKGLTAAALIVPLLIVLAGCGGVTTTASVSQPVGSLNLNSDTSTGAADGYVYIPVGQAPSRLVASDIRISSDSTPPGGFAPAVGATVGVDVAAQASKLVSSTQTDANGHYALVYITPGAYTLTVTVGSVSNTWQITIQADSTTHGNNQPTPDHPFAGFTRKHIDLTTNSSWQDVSDRIESIEDLQFSFDATNNSGGAATLDLYVSQNPNLTAVTISDSSADTPPAFRIYHFDLPAGGPTTITSDASNTIAENQQEFRDQVKTGKFNLYALVTPAVGSSFTISNVTMKIKLKLRVI